MDMEGIVVVFDFDKTIIECDSDNFVIDELGFTKLFNELLPTKPWNTVMDLMMTEMHAQGVTINQVKEVLARVPIHPRIVPAIKAAYAAGCDLRIVSDANEFFIETVLDHLGVRHCFSGINTNPGKVDGEGRLRIQPYHDFNVAPHGCCRCPPNMCKGPVVERLLSELGDKKFVYLGDGIGDYCPCLKLRACDYAMPRKDFPVWGLICAHPKEITAKIHEWVDGEQFESKLLSIIQFILANGDHDDATAKSIIVDCKFQEMPFSSHEFILPRVLCALSPHLLTSL